MTVQINVGPSLTRLIGLAPATLNDTLQDAPEPPIPQWPAGSLRTTGANLRYLATRFPAEAFVDPDRRLLDARMTALIENQRLVEPGDYEAAFPFKTVPRPPQMKIFAAARLMTKIALAPVTVGGGKTKMCLDVAADKFLRNEIDALCVIASPAGVPRQWIEEGVATHLSDAVPRECYVWKPTRKVPETMMRPDGRRRLRIMAFNTEAFSGESGRAFVAAKEFMQTFPGRVMLVLDESSRIKNPRAIRTKAILRLRDMAAVRVISTGTPITKGIENLYTQYHFLDPNIIGMSSYYTFRARYCILQPIPRAPAGAMRIAGYRNVEELINRIAPYTFVMPVDVLGLPPKVFETWEVSMAPEQARIYKAMAKQLIDELRAGQIVSSTNAAARLTRLQQVTSGRYFREVRTGERDENGDEIVRHEKIDLALNPRLDYLIDKLNDYDGQVVIVCRFRDDVQDVAKALNNIGYPVVTYTGETSEAERAAAKRAFVEGDARYIVGNEAMCMGLDGLQVASLMVFYSHTFNAEHRWQMEGRIHRIGMQGTAFYADMVMPGTCDRLFVKNREEKFDIAQAVARHPRMLLEVINEPV